MSKSSKPIPDGYHTITPYLVVKGAEKAIDFYKKAFGALEVHRMAGPEGKILHAELQIGDSRVMLSEEFIEMRALSPQTIGGTPIHLFLYVPDVDTSFRKAVEAGAASEMKPEDMFWGDRYAKLSDPFGHRWSMATHKEDLTPEEIRKRQDEFFARRFQGAGKA
jgi:PhnB protein